MNKYEEALNKINDIPECFEEELKCLNEACKKAEVFDLIDSTIGINIEVRQEEPIGYIDRVYLLASNNKKYYMGIASDYIEITKEQYNLLERLII